MSSPRLVYQQGDHVCTLFSTREEQLSAAVEYIRMGLRRGERCLYVCEEAPDEFRAVLRKNRIDVAREERRDALLVLTKHDGHLEGGAFDPTRMIRMLKQAVEDALSAGFTGLCAAGDMSWVLDDAPGTDQLLEYEAKLNAFYRKHRALGLCQYHRRRLPAAILEACMATHPYVRAGGPILLKNPFYELPEDAMKIPVRRGRAVKRKLARLDDLSTP